MRCWEEKDVREKIMRLENNKKTRENSCVLFVTLKSWLEEDERKGVIRRRGQANASRTEVRPKQPMSQKEIMEAETKKYNCWCEENGKDPSDSNTRLEYCELLKHGQVVRI